MRVTIVKFWSVPYPYEWKTMITSFTLFLHITASYLAKKFDFVFKLTDNFLPLVCQFLQLPFRLLGMVQFLLELQAIFACIWRLVIHWYASRVWNQVGMICRICCVFTVVFGLVGLSWLNSFVSRNGGANWRAASLAFLCIFCKGNYFSQNLRDR